MSAGLTGGGEVDRRLEGHSFASLPVSLLGLPLLTSSWLIPVPLADVRSR